MNSDAVAEPDHVDFWFDVVCPFAWVTSRWIVEVASLRPIDVQWRPMCLAITNEGVDISDERQAILLQSWQGARVCAAIEGDHSNSVLGRFYAAVGTRLHVDGQPFDAALVAGALADAGLPATLLEAMADATLDGPVRISHEEGQSTVGHTTGTPIVSLDGRGYFGPVVSVIPRGEDALRLYDGLRLVSSVPGFAELKRARDELVTS